MNNYLLVLAIGIILTLVVGQILLRTGRGFLSDVYDDPRTADSANRLVVVMFHLIVLGVLALLSTVHVGGDAVQSIVIRIGVILLVLGIAHGLTVLALARIRARQREEEVQEEIHQQYEAVRRMPTSSGGGSSTTRPVIEMGHGPGR